MIEATKILKWILWPAVLVGLAWCLYFIGWVYLENDEVADCQLKQWWAGGKKPPDIDLLPNIAFQNDEKNIVADFRALEQNWSHICMTSLYQPGWPYLSRRDAHFGGSVTPRTIGCWAGDDPSRLTLLLLNRHTGEDEYHQISVPPQVRDRMRGPILETNYRIPELPDGVFQCSETSTAVAACLRLASTHSDYCLLVFHR